MDKFVHHLVSIDLKYLFSMWPSVGFNWNRVHLRVRVFIIRTIDGLNQVSQIDIYRFVITTGTERCVLIRAILDKARGQDEWIVRYVLKKIWFWKLLLESFLALYWIYEGFENRKENISSSKVNLAFRWFLIYLDLIAILNRI